MTLELTRANGLPRLAYRVEGSGAPLVLVHGVGGDSSNWDDVVPRLAPKFRVIRMDLRGHGRSGPINAPCRAEDFARDVTDVMQAAGVDACRLVGFSLGGQVVQAIALDSPERVQKLVLISTIAGRTEAERSSVASRLAELQAKGIATIAAGNRDRWFTQEFQRAHPEKVERRVEQLLQTDPESYQHAYSVFATTDFANRLEEIRAPTLVITGENDMGATPRMARLMHERIKNAELRILSRLRHSLLIESPDQIAGLLNGFL
jgi:(E)-2-((N-methylformamido)methylene)succinate hydrolase